MKASRQAWVELLQTIAATAEVEIDCEVFGLRAAELGPPVSTERMRTVLQPLLDEVVG